MQDWLSTYKLDRKALAALAANLAAVEAYEVYTAQVVRAVVADVVDSVVKGPPFATQDAAQTVLQADATQSDGLGTSSDEFCLCYMVGCGSWKYGKTQFSAAFLHSKPAQLLTERSVSSRHANERASSVLLGDLGGGAANLGA